jgi:hypothetical protein
MNYLLKYNISYEFFSRHGYHTRLVTYGEKESRICKKELSIGYTEILHLQRCLHVPICTFRGLECEYIKIAVYSRIRKEVDGVSRKVVNILYFPGFPSCNGKIFLNYIIIWSSVVSGTK